MTVFGTKTTRYAEQLLHNNVRILPERNQLSVLSIYMYPSSQIKLPAPTFSHLTIVVSDSQIDHPIFPLVNVEQSQSEQGVLSKLNKWVPHILQAGPQSEHSSSHKVQQVLGHKQNHAIKRSWYIRILTIFKTQQISHKKV
jgi:hypothetical protein